MILFLLTILGRAHVFPMWYQQGVRGMGVDDDWRIQNGLTPYVWDLGPSYWLGHLILFCMPPSVSR